MIQLNEEQEYVVSEAINWYRYSNEQLFQYDGCPGSGKSVVLNEIVNRLKLDPLREVAAMSYIGAASLVMRMKGLISAKTAHSWLYDVVPVKLRDKHGEVIMDDTYGVPIMVPKFILVDKLDPGIKLIIVDEAYSMPLKMRSHIEKFGIKIIACGDQNQLPPVNDLPAFLTNGKIYHLTKCMRQAGRNDIQYICNRINNRLPLLNGYYGNSLIIDRSELTDEMLLWADAVICCKNSTRDNINQRIRSILGHTSMLPEYGERLVCRHNNWLNGISMSNGSTVNLVNGLIGTVRSMPDVSSFDKHLFSMDFVPDIVPNIRFTNLRCNYKHMISDNDTRVTIRQNRYEKGEMFEYAYAITAHIAQGSQFNRVVYIEEHMHPSIQTALNLVGASRAVQQLIYVRSIY